MDRSQTAVPEQHDGQLRDLERRIYAYFGESWGLSARDVDARFSPSERDFYYLEHLSREQEAIDHQMIAVSRAVGSLFSKETTLPYISARYRQLITQTAHDHRKFPYDIRFLPAVQIHELVAHSVQYRVTESVFHYAKDTGLPPEVLQELSALQHSRQEGDFRVKGWFTEQAFLQAVERVTGKAFVEQDRENLLAAAQRFPRCKGVVWSPDRGRAALSKDVRQKRAAASSFLWEKWQEMREVGKELTLHQLKLWHDIERIQERLAVPAWFIDSLHLEGTEQERRSRAQETWNRRLGESTIHDLHQQMRTTMHEIQHSLTTVE